MRQIFILVLTATVAFALPEILDFSGNPIDGQNLTISGTGFGTNDAHIEWTGQWIEDGNIGDEPTWNNWVFNYDDNNITDSQAHSGTKSLENYLLRNTAYAACMRYGHTSPVGFNEDIFISWWVRREHVGGGQWKMFRTSYANDITDASTPQFKMFNWDDGVNGPQFFVSAGPGTDATNASWSMPYPNADDRWFRMDIEVHTASGHAVSDGKYTVRRSDPVGGDTFQQNTLNGAMSFNDDNDYYQWFIWQNYIGNGDLQTQTTWTDDMLIQIGSKARVELCDNATYSESTHCEFQYPLNWTDNSIVIDFNMGSFALQDDAYLFLIDNEDNISSGYHIIIGQNSQDCTGVCVSDINESSIENGQTLIINGNGFGNNGPNVHFFTDFEQGNNGDVILTGNGSAEVGEISSVDAVSSLYSSSTSVSGSLSFQTNMESSETGRGSVVINLPENTTDLFVSWYLYLPSEDNYPGEGGVESINWKQLWVLGADTGTDDLVVPTLLGNADGTGLSWLINGNDPNPGYASYTGTNFRKGVWSRFAFWLKGGNSSDGQCHFWTTDSEDGTVLRNWDNDVNTLKTGGNRRQVILNGYGRTAVNSHPTFDDVYIATGATARARVEFGDNESYENCTTFATAVPSNWSNSQMTIKFYQGSFQGNSQAYIYVTDAEGNISEGYPITISQTNHPADTNHDYELDKSELVAYIDVWKSGAATISSLFEAIDFWK